MDSEIQELLKLAGIGHTPVEYKGNSDGEESPLTLDTLEDDVEEDFLASKGEDDLYNPEEDPESDDEDDQVVAESNEEDEFDLDFEDSESEEEDDDLVYDLEDELEIEEAKGDEFELDMDDDESEIIHPKSLSMHNPEIDDEEQDVMIRFENEEAHDLIDELFGALAERGIEGEIILPPRVRGSVVAALAEAGFDEDSDYHFVDPMNEIDLQNGYGQHHSIDGEDYFPSGETGPAAKELGPSAARHGNNPLATRIKESNNLYEYYSAEYNTFKKENEK